MTLPDYPMSLARDRFGLWLHVTGLSLREVVEVLPHCFEADALLVYDDEQLDHASSQLIHDKLDAGTPRADLVAELARLDRDAFWNVREPLFENAAAVVWPVDCLDEMIRAQGTPGGCFGLTPVSRGVAARLRDDFVYEHPSNVDARFSFLSTDDRATSIFVADEADVQALVRLVVAKALGVAAGEAEALDDVASRLRPLLEQGGIDIRARGDAADGARRSAVVAVGQWPLRSQWPLLWRDVPLCEIAWDGRRWALSEVRHEPGRQFVSTFRLIGELFHWTGHLTRYAVVVGLPLAVAAFAWATTGWLGGLVALLVAIVLWPRFVLGMDWYQLRQRRADDQELRRKYE
jgi:hypothetical protein